MERDSTPQSTYKSKKYFKTIYINTGFLLSYKTNVKFVIINLKKCEIKLIFVRKLLEMKKHDLIVLIALLISPIFVNYVILGISVGANVNGSTDAWLGFYGTLVGSLITMFILYRTRKWNIDDNTDTRNLQNKILKYQAKQVWLEGLRKQLDANYRILNFQETIIAAEDIAIGNCQTAMNYLLNLNKDIEMQGYSFDLYLSGDNLNEYEIKYIDCYQQILKQYGDYVNDLIFICGIKIQISQNGSVISYINESIKQIYELNEINSQTHPSILLNKLKEKVNSTCTFSELENICISRVNEIGFIHSEKIKLQEVTSQLLKFEEKEIENILL